MSFATLSAPSARISTIKRAEDDDSIVVRCYDLDGEGVEARLSLFVPISSAHACNMIEDEGPALSVKEGGVSFRIGPFAIETVKLKR